MIEHTVTFRLMHLAGSPGEFAFLEAAAQLATIPGVQNFVIRRQISPKNDHTFGISMAFGSGAELQAYSDHPRHIAFVRDRWIPEVEDLREADFEPLG